MRLFKAVISITAFVCFTSCDNFIFKSDLPQILGVKDVKIEKSTSLNEWGGVQGEGFVLEVCKLSETTIEDFLHRSNKYLVDKNDNRWKKDNWSDAPFDTTKYKEVLIMALNYSTPNKEVMSQLKDIKEILSKRRVYHAFYYRPNKDVEEYIEAIQFFVLDLDERRLYAIDSSI